MAAPSSFEECVTFSVKSMGIDFDLKEKQIEILKALYTGKDCRYSTNWLLQKPYLSAFAIFSAEKIRFVPTKACFDRLSVKFVDGGPVHGTKEEGVKSLYVKYRGDEGIVVQTWQFFLWWWRWSMIRIYGITLLILWSFLLCVSLCFVTICIVYNCSIK